MPTNISAVWANDGGDKVTRDERRASISPSSVYNSIWPNPGTTVTLFGAMNEVVSFNLIMETAGVSATAVSVSLSNLVGPGGSIIRSVPRATNNLFDWTTTEIELFYIRYLQILGLDNFGYANYGDVPHLMEPQVAFKMRVPLVGGNYPGGWVDRPNHDKFFPEIPVPLELVPPFTIAINNNQSIWADIYIPKTVNPGSYSGTLTITENSVVTFTIPVSLIVKNFTLPDMPNAKTMLYTAAVQVSKRYTGVQYPVTGTPEDILLRKALANQNFVAHRHKLSMINDDIYAPTSPPPEYVPYLTGTAYTAANGYAGPGVGTGNNVYCIGSYGLWLYGAGAYIDNMAWASGVMTVTTRNPHGFAILSVQTLTIAGTFPIIDAVYSCTIRGASTFTFSISVDPGIPTGPNGLYVSQALMRSFCDGWESWFIANAPATERFVYLRDEAPASYYPLVQQWADWMKTNPGPGSTLNSMATITPPQDAVASEPSLTRPDSTFIAGLTADWQNAVTTINGTAGKRFWTYNGPRPGQGCVAMESDGTDLRELPWGNYKMGSGRWFEFESTYYDDSQNASGPTDVFNKASTFGSANPTFYPVTGLRYVGNGEGVFFYPGTDVVFPASSYGVKGPFASLRLKHLRRGVQDVDYITLAKAVDASATAAIVQNMVPLAMWELTVGNPASPTYYIDTSPSWSANPDVWEAARAQLAAIILGPAPPVPVNTAIPVVSGIAQVGQTLTTTNGSWTNSPTSFIYQWYRAGTLIGSATAVTYVPVSGDVGNALTVWVTAVNGAGSGTPATSAATASVIDIIPTINVAASIPGTPQAGVAKTAIDATWIHSVTSRAYQWKSSGVNAAGAGVTTLTYTPVAGDVGNTLTITVTATNTGGTSAPSTSAASATVIAAAAGIPVNTVLPSISGIAQVGQTLTASPGSWTN